MSKIKIAGLDLKWFLVISGVIAAGCALGAFPAGMVGAFLFLMLFGEFLNLLGNVTPFVKTYLGGGAIVCIFVGAALVYWHIVPNTVAENCSVFMKSAGFLDFYIAALITGSILGMNRKLLMRAAIRYLPCIVGAVACALGLVAISSALAPESPSPTSGSLLWAAAWEPAPCPSPRCLKPPSGSTPKRS